MTEDFDFIYCDNGIAAAGATVEPEAVAGASALHKFTGRDQFAVHM